MIQLAALIDGKPVTTAAEVPVEDPSTGEVLASTADCGPTEIGLAVQAAQAASRSWRRVSVPERARVLRRLSALIERYAESLGRLESQQTGKPLRQALHDAEITVRYFDFYASAVETFYGQRSPWTSTPACRRAGSRTGSPGTSSRGTTRCRSWAGPSPRRWPW